MSDCNLIYMNENSNEWVYMVNNKFLVNYEIHCHLYVSPLDNMDGAYYVMIED